jgi:hypothetical protein
MKTVEEALSLSQRFKERQCQRTKGEGELLVSEGGKGGRGDENQKKPLERVRGL